VAASLVSRGASTSPPVRPVATHIARQNGQVISSPMACRTGLPWSRTTSLTSAAPPGSVYRVNGARNGLVTESLASSRLSLCVAIEISTTSEVVGRSGTGRPVALAAAARLAASAPNAPMAAT
jgi:hypothetical protein